jgi:hypothetical protein
VLEVVAGNGLAIRLQAAAPTPMVGSRIAREQFGSDEIRLSRQGNFLVMRVDHPTKG